MVSNIARQQNNERVPQLVGTMVYEIENGSADRLMNYPSYAYTDIGFRCARQIIPAAQATFGIGIGPAEGLADDGNVPGRLIPTVSLDDAPECSLVLARIAVTMSVPALLVVEPSGSCVLGKWVLRPYSARKVT